MLKNALFLLDCFPKGETMPKAQQARGLSVLANVTSLGLVTISCTNLIKFHLQNLDQATTSNSQPNVSISTKLKLQNLDQPYLQNRDQDST